jgi:homocysteine S-methyltransferase
MFENPIQPFIERYGLLILDGGLATELEARGYDLGDALWSARLLKDDPDAIRQVHYDYLAAGADCVISASYQATVQGFTRAGLSQAQAEQLLRRSVALAREARDQFWSEEANRAGRLRPLVAASVGPYGAFLADGSEYTGDYGLDVRELTSFHRRRWHILSESGPELLACETIPSAVEARALARLSAETPEMPAWFSFSCRDGAHINDGTPIIECVEPLERLPQVVAVGINCTAPRHIPSLVSAVRSVSTKPVIVYPNSGEQYDVVSKQWTGLSFPEAFAQQSREWRAAGASLLGGCCRTGPQHIRQLRQLHHQGRTS